MTVPLERFRAPELVRALAAAIAAAADHLGHTRIMHICGTHEHELQRFALRQLLPSNLELIAGPGCPVCITPAAAILTARRLALSASRPILATYGDILRVPTTEGTLLDGRQQGGDIRLVSGPADAVRLAHENPGREVVFFSIGFETTAAPVAAILTRGVPSNLSLYTCHRYVPAAVETLVAADADGSLAGFLLPGHASVITGTVAYRFLPEKFGRAAATTGFEPVDILRGILAIVKQLRGGSPTVQNCYERAVRECGNIKAQEAIARAFDRTDALWRGIGLLPGTGFELKPEWRSFSARERFLLMEEAAEDILPGCSCHLIMLGKRKPDECPLFGKECTPVHPRGPCMVSQEGTCRAWYLFRESS